MAKKKTSKHPKLIRNMWLVFGGLWVVVILFFTFLSLGWLGFMPSFDELENPRSMQATEVLSDDGEVLGFDCRPAPEPTMLCEPIRIPA